MTTPRNKTQQAAAKAIMRSGFGDPNADAEKDDEASDDAETEPAGFGARMTAAIQRRLGKK